MSIKALLFPGQGSQIVGMGKDIAGQYQEANELLEKANDILKIDLKRLCFEGPEEELKKTDITQPAIFIISAVIFEIFKRRGIDFHFTAGHSLGEYCAYYAAGYFSFEEGLKAVRKRGQIMALADKEQKGTMAAILGLEDEKVKEICKKALSLGTVVPANFNSKGQVVISGEKNAVAEACKIAEKENATAIPLAVSGAFHSPLMEPVCNEFKEYLAENLNITPNGNIKVFTNVTAGSVDFSEIKPILVKQLTSPVLWKTSIENLIKEGVEIFIEIGPKRVLTNMMKRIDRKVPCYCTENLSALEKVFKEVS
jgi:[acyl-carrier-protein] S-malonyltransferase